MRIGLEQNLVPRNVFTRRAHAAKRAITPVAAAVPRKMSTGSSGSRDVQSNAITSTTSSTREELRRQAQLLLQQENSWWQQPQPANVAVATSPRHFKELVLAAGKDQVVVADYFAPHCSACRRMFYKLGQIASNSPDVRFVMVNSEASKEMMDLACGMGVDRLPYFQLFKNGELVSSFTANLQKIDVLRAELAASKECTAAECEDH